MIKNYITPLILLLLISACGGEKGLPLVQAKRTNSVIDFSGNTFFSEIVDIDLTEDKLFFADKGSKRILVTDHNFGFIDAFGNSGEGPLDIRQASNFDIYNDTLYMNAGGGKMIRYTMSGQPIESFNYKLLGNYEFHIDQDGLFSFDYDSVDEPLAKFDASNGMLLSNFGVVPNPGIGGTRQHVVRLGDLLVATYAVNAPVVNVYGQDGTLLKSTDLSSMELIQQLEQNREEPGVQGGSNVKIFNSIFRDVWASDDRLFLLTITAPELGVIKCNNILECRINKDFSIEPVKIIQLNPDGWYNSIAMKKGRNELIAFENVNGTIDTYNLN